MLYHFSLKITNLTHTHTHTTTILQMVHLQVPPQTFFISPDRINKSCGDRTKIMQRHKGNIPVTANTGKEREWDIRTCHIQSLDTCRSRLMTHTLVLSKHREGGSLVPRPNVQRGYETRREGEWDGAGYDSLSVGVPVGKVLVHCGCQWYHLGVRCPARA